MASVVLRMGLVILASGWVSMAYGQATASTSATKTQAHSPVDDDAQEKLLQQAMEQIQAGKSADAIDGPLAQIIQTYETAYGHSKKRIYCAETMTESLIYLGSASKDHQEAEVLAKPTWALAYFLRGYAYGELGDMTKEQASLNQALALSPFNSHFLSELGNTYQTQKNWSAAMETYKSAEGAAEFAPPDQQIPLRCRSLRGQGFVLVELHKLDDAAQKYQDCLRIKPGDQTSINELGYVKKLQGKAAK
ncbi:hypothetical protein [Dyella sp. 2HG41-7]|uniref:tetratricopeptide repeat protein n=1 Tax=Dyella sp. 2HG41-7 TaxID=2883239 RepID=UPI001F2310E4|nr:hypothetical protein [Dyella sp. 2HG41-7]